MSNPTNDGINLNYLANVRPSSQQLVWQRMEMYAFIHFGMNTMTDREWGLGHEDPALFNPQNVDVEQWMDALVAGGMTGVILLYSTCFRLSPSNSVRPKTVGISTFCAYVVYSLSSVIYVVFRGHRIKIG